MAKRRAAEPLAFHVPWKRLLPCGRLDDPEPPPPPPWVPPGLGPRLSANGSELRRKRKREDGTMAELLASPSKRSGDASGGPGGPAPGDGTRMDTGEPKPPAEPRGSAEEEAGPRPPLHPRASEPERGAGEDAPRPRDARPREEEEEEEELIEEFWQYNTFQYWRNPLPSIDLSEIEKLTEATLASKDEGVEIDMES